MGAEASGSVLANRVNAHCDYNNIDTLGTRIYLATRNNLYGKRIFAGPTSILI